MTLYSTHFYQNHQLILYLQNILNFYIFNVSHRIEALYFINLFNLIDKQQFLFFVYKKNHFYVK